MINLIESILMYIPELIGGIIIAVLTFWLTRLSEQSKNKEKTKRREKENENKIERLRIEYEAKINEQKLNFQHKIQLLEKEHELDLEKQRLESKDQDLKSIFNGEYDMNEIAEQFKGMEKLIDQIDKFNKSKKHVKDRSSQS